MDIYEPAEDSYLLKKHVQKEAFGRVLDIGTGSGIQALSLTKKQSRNSKNSGMSEKQTFLTKVKTITAIDINKKAIKQLKEKTKVLRHFHVEESNLFENIPDKFETIIFNAPYLPQDYIADKKIEDPALYGGKQGWETIEEFFKQVGDHLVKESQILLLFSSLTDKEEVEKIIKENLYSFEELERQKLPMFETLYVYKITATALRNTLQSQGVKDIQYFDKGRRGLIYKGRWDKNAFTKKFLAKRDEVTVAIKIKNEASTATGRIKNEIYWLKQCNKENIGPKLYFYGRQNEYIVREFIEGEFLPDFLENKANKEKIKTILKDILNQCFILDKMKMSKDEFTRPLKNVMVNKEGKAILLDFERCRNDLEPTNVTQFVSFLANHDHINKEKAIELSKAYKTSYKEKEFKDIETLL